jgi:hypothetical protein
MCIYDYLGVIQSWASFVSLRKVPVLGSLALEKSILLKPKNGSTKKQYLNEIKSNF